MNGFKNKKVILEVEQAIDIVNYLNTIPGVTSLPSDDLVNGQKGFLTFHQVGDSTSANHKEEALWIGTQNWKPVPEEDRKTIRCGDLTVEMSEWLNALITKCITEEGWIQCDNPMKLVVGWVKLAELDSDEESKGVFISLVSFKQISQDVRKRVEKWRLEKAGMTEDSPDA